MKVTNLRRKLAAALVAGGMLTPVATQAADLDVNLVVNGGFENVDYVNTGAYNSPDILDWGGTIVGGAYSHTGYNGTGDYANGGSYTGGSPLTGGGDFYFSPGNRGNQSLADALTQDIDVSTGASAALISSGNAAFSLSAFFSSFGGQADRGVVDIEFLDSGDGSLGMAQVTPGGNLSDWTQVSSGGVIPVGTETVRLSAWGVLVDGGSSDGYMDNVDFQVTDEVILQALDLRVDRDDGSLILTNKTGSPVNIAGYQISSEFGGLDPSAWVSIAENYDADSGSSVDGTNVWSEFTKSDAHGDLSEADLESGDGGSLAHTQSINLGNAGSWIKSPQEDLIFQYTSDGEVVTGIVNFEDAAEFEEGDFNTDGDINATDWAILRSNLHVDLTGLSLAEAYRSGDLTADGATTHADFAEFKSVFDAANGAGSFLVMIGGQNAIPEPSSVVLVLMAGVAVCGAMRVRGSKT